MGEVAGKKCTGMENLYFMLSSSLQLRTPVRSPERIEPQDLIYGRQVLKTEPFFCTLLLEALPVVWKVECPELGEAGEDAGQALQGVVGQVQAPQVMQTLKLIKNIYSKMIEIFAFCYVTYRSTDQWILQKYNDANIC